MKSGKTMLLSQLQMRQRYARFFKASFGVAPHTKKNSFLKDLLPLEHGFAFSQNCIGKVEQFPFDLELIDTTPIKAKPITYSPENREWIKQCVNALVRVNSCSTWNGAARYTSNMVLASNQTGQKARLCQNFTTIN